jgi:hypothetical protein
VLIDDDLKNLVQGGEIRERIQLPVEVGLICKDGEQHLIAFVGGLPAFQYTYPKKTSGRKVSAAIGHLRTNLWSTVFSLVKMLGQEAVELPGFEKRREVARLWSKAVAKQSKQDATGRQKHEISRTESEAATLNPILKSHHWRANLLKRSLAAMAELRQEKKRISQTAVAAIVYKRRARYQLESASSQYWRELTQGFGRPASQTFAMLSKVNKTWEELTSDERSELNCPESTSVNTFKVKKTRKKFYSV